MTSTDICNLALAALGAGRIISLNDETETARLCRLQYDPTRKLLLRQVPWGFARKVDKAEELTMSVNGYKVAYHYPRSCLRILDLVRENEKYEPEKQKPYAVMNVTNELKAICCDERILFIEYIKDIEDSNVFDDIFVDTFVHKLASALAMSVSGSSNLADMQYQMYQASLQEAKSMNAKENKHKLNYVSSYIQARSF